MPDNLPAYLMCFAAMLIAACISMFVIRQIISITRKRRLYDVPDNIRKIHGSDIPSLGGTGIFLGYMLTSLFFMPDSGGMFHYITLASLLLFFTGVYDDIMNMKPLYKLTVQLVASFITVYYTHLGFPALYSTHGAFILPYASNLALTTLACTFFINVYNFIDGIDGLACMLAIFYSAILGCLFLVSGHTEGAIPAFSLMGAAIGLLYYNYAPARIYMGDTGSMLTGYSIFLLSLYLVNMPPATGDIIAETFIHSQGAAIVIVAAMLLLPVADAIRVFVLRIAKGISPMQAGREHLHYYLIDGGFTHVQAAWLLVSTQAITSILAFLLQGINIWLLMGIIALPSVLVMLMAARLKSGVNEPLKL